MSYVRMCIIFLFLCGISKNSFLVADYNFEPVDVVVFSYDRPIQLYSFLESFREKVKGAEHVSVIYRVDDERYARAYEEVKKEFPKVSFFLQSTENLDASFNGLLMHCSFGQLSRANYILFAVDDIIITRCVDLTECTHALASYDSHALFLRLGLNITKCYSLSEDTPVPPHQRVADQFIRWKFADGKGDWNYPHSVDMTVYRKGDILAMLENLQPCNPNHLEALLAELPPKRPTGLCFQYSCMVNLPLNKVFPSNNRSNSNNAFLASALLTEFEKGKKIDISPFHNLLNQAPHADLPVTFISRYPGAPEGK